MYKSPHAELRKRSAKPCSFTLCDCIVLVVLLKKYLILISICSAYCRNIRLSSSQRRNTAFNLKTIIHYDVCPLCTKDTDRIGGIAAMMRDGRLARTVASRREWTAKDFSLWQGVLSWGDFVGGIMFGGFNLSVSRSRRSPSGIERYCHCVTFCQPAGVCIH